jgi:hypothetical protein
MTLPVSVCFLRIRRDARRADLANYVIADVKRQVLVIHEGGHHTHKQI